MHKKSTPPNRPHPEDTRSPPKKIPETTSSHREERKKKIQAY